MNATPQDAAADPRAPWARLHRALMPDYNRKATGYWWTMVTLGVGTLVHALGILLALPGADQLQVGVGFAIALLAGFFPVRVPRSTNSFAAGEIFIFLLLLMHGPAAATLAAAGEGLIGSWRTSKRWTSRIVSPAMAAVAMFSTGSLLQAAIAALKTYHLYSAGLVLAATMLCAVFYFVLTTLLITAVPYLKRSQWPAARELLGSFGWVGIVFAGSASVACLLFLALEHSGIGVLVAAGPIIAMLLATLHYHFRQQEADEAVRQSRLAAVEREAELAARHMGELEISERRFHNAFTHASIGMALVSFEGQVLQANPALRALLGMDDGGAIEECKLGDLVHGDGATVLSELLGQLKSQQIPSFAADLRLRHRQEVEVWAAVNVSFFSDAGSTAPSLIIQVQDITARRQAEAGLNHIAFHDSLTGLPNRRRFHGRLAEALNDARSDASGHFGLMFLDFDRFKLINDSLGHAVGDEFLEAAARRIQQQLRPQDFIARLGGDEFAILVEKVDGKPYAATLAARLLDVLRQPFQIAGTEISTSASIGITFSSMGYSTPEEMLRDADIAMYKAKAGGKARFALFDTALHTEVSHRLRLEGDLRRALAAGELSVAYQPLINLATGSVTGFEALARWNHAELGAISPVSFIAVAEESGLIMPLTDFMLRSACQQLKRWQERDSSFGDLNMHVNVSGSDISSPGFVARVTAALIEARLEPQHLTLELTENILIERLEAALPALTELRRLGIGLSVDDFGTGHSSLRHLSKLPVTSLKIDRAFVADMRSGSDAAVVRSIVSLGHSLGKSIIAEGIENAEQVGQLKQLGCTVGQGYHLSRPATAEQIDRMLDESACQAFVVADLERLDRPALVH